MPVIYDIMPDFSLVYLAGFGYCTGTAFRTVTLDIARDERNGSSSRRIIDLTGVKELDVRLDEIKGISSESKQLEEAGMYVARKAAIIGRDDMDEILVRLYATFVRESNVEIKSFLILRPALVWLGLEAAEGRILALRDAMRERAGV